MPYLFFIITAFLAAFNWTTPVEANSIRGSASVRMLSSDQLGGLRKQSDMVFSSASPVQLASTQPEGGLFVPGDLLDGEPARFSLPGPADKHFTLSLPADGTVYLDCISGSCAGSRIPARTFHESWTDEETESGERYLEVNGTLDLSDPGLTGSFQGTFQMLLHYE